MQATSSSKIKEAEEALSKAKVHLMTKQGAQFMCNVSMMLTHEISDEIPTAATNGTFVKYNPDFFLSISKEERVGLIYHEVSHVAFMHMFRCGERDKLLWNYAADFVINVLAIDNGFKLPAGGCYDPIYRGWSTEQVYDHLLSNSIQVPVNFDSDLQEAENATEEGKEELTNIVMGAAQRTLLNHGDVPAEIAKMIEKLINPVLNWKEILYRFVDDRTKEDSSWKKPNHKYLPEFYLPSKFSQNINHLTVAIDTSGSMTKEYLEEILSEIQYINDTLQPTNLTVLDCDVEIHNIYHVLPQDSILDYKFTGGGGTRFSPVIKYCNDNHTNVLVYFTDLWAAPVQEMQSFPILWVCSSDHEPALIGETVYVHN